MANRTHRSFGLSAPALARADIRRELGGDTLAKGELIQAAGGVLDVVVEDDVILGRVSGSRRWPYEQSIELHHDGSGWCIDGECSCPMIGDCKHVAAVLVEWLIRRERQPAPSPEAPAADPKPSLSSYSLPDDVAGWISMLGAVSAPVPVGKAQDRRLIYILNPLEFPSKPLAAPIVQAVTANLRKDGVLTNVKPYDVENVLRWEKQRGRYVNEADLMILRDMAWLRRSATGLLPPEVQLGGDAVSARLLDAMLASGRLRLSEPNGIQLAAGPAVGATVEWKAGPDGLQKLLFVPYPGAQDAAFEAVLPLAPPRYLDKTRGLIGMIDSGLSQTLAAHVVTAPALSLKQAVVAREMIKQQLRHGSTSPGRPKSKKDEPGQSVLPPALPLPFAPDGVRTRIAVPKARLELFMVEAGLKTNQHWLGRSPTREERSLPAARLSFDYDGHVIGHADKTQMIETMEDGGLTLIPRDRRAEAKAADRLRNLNFRHFLELPLAVPGGNESDLFLAPTGFNPGNYQHAWHFLVAFNDEDRFIAFSLETVPKLAAEDWDVFFSDDYAYKIVDSEPGWWAGTDSSSGIDWFSFELGIEFEGHRINLVDRLLDVLNQQPDLLKIALDPATSNEYVKRLSKLRLFHKLPDNRLLPLPGERLAPILKALVQLIGPRHDRVAGGKVKLYRAEAASLSAFANDAGDGISWAVDASRLLELGNNLLAGRARGQKPILPPPSFKATLRPYQTDGLAWLDFIRQEGFGGVLADDMGLGKTVQALAFLSREKSEGRLNQPALIIAPTSVLPNWETEAQKFAPELSVLALRGLDRKRLFMEMANNDLVITTYPLLTRDHEVLLDRTFHVAILDEAQAIKNPKANVAALAHRIKANHRVALTGTPLENNLGEVWSLFEFLNPGLLGDESTFRRVFRTPIEKHDNKEAQAFLSRRLKPFMLRRTKEEVATELPPKTEIVEHIRLEGAQRDLYETVRSLMHAKVRDEIAKRGLAKSHILFLDALLKLRQICCDPRLLKMPQAKAVKKSAKLERLMEIVPELVGEGRRILIFSQFTSMLALIEAELNALRLPYVLLTGDTKDRATPVKTFQAGKVPIFLLSLKAGGTGLNLTAADTVIHYDPWWNPAVEAQATDRAHRIGQQKPVFVYKLVVEEGVEKAIEQLKIRKAALAEALFDGCAKTSMAFTEDDVAALFAPLTPQPVRKAA